MERIRVSISDPGPSQVQGSVSEFNVGEEFTTPDLLLDHLRSHQLKGALQQMNCVIPVGDPREGRWKKIFDPRTSGEQVSSPGECRGCHFNSSGTVGCVIRREHIRILYTKR